jgi:hypothetical protein
MTHFWWTVLIVAGVIVICAGGIIYGGRLEKRRWRDHPEWKP